MSSVVKVEKLNSVYLKIEAEADVRRELTDYFSFEVPGYKFTPQFRNRVWDGKIRLYSYATGQIYFGLYPYLKDWANRKNIKIEENNDISTNKTHTAADIQAMIESYDISITPRDYQIDAFKYALDYDRGLILSRTASG